MREVHNLPLKCVYDNFFDIQRASAEAEKTVATDLERDHAIWHDYPCDRLAFWCNS